MKIRLQVSINITKRLNGADSERAFTSGELRPVWHRNQLSF